MEMKTIIMSVMVLLLAVSLIGTIADTVQESRVDGLGNSTNVTGTTGVLLALISLVFASGIVVMAYKEFIGNK